MSDGITATFRKTDLVGKSLQDDWIRGNLKGLENCAFEAHVLDEPVPADAKLLKGSRIDRLAVYKGEDSILYFDNGEWDKNETPSTDEHQKIVQAIVAAFPAQGQP